MQHVSILSFSGYKDEKGNTDIVVPPLRGCGALISAYKLPFDMRGQATTNLADYPTYVSPLVRRGFTRTPSLLAVIGSLPTLCQRPLVA